jgi:hypothetical protein
LNTNTGILSNIVSSLASLRSDVSEIKNGVDSNIQNNIVHTNETHANEIPNEQRCTSDYNTNVGDPQNDNYFVCPASKPTCIGFELNKSWGTCN